MILRLWKESARNERAYIQGCLVVAEVVNNELNWLRRSVIHVSDPETTKRGLPAAYLLHCSL